MAQGYKEAVLTGIHLSSYGIEHMEGNPVSQGDWNHRELLALIREVHEIEGWSASAWDHWSRVLLQKSLLKVWQSS